MMGGTFIIDAVIVGGNLKEILNLDAFRVLEK
jgi:hypothetical protein